MGIAYANIVKGSFEFSGCICQFFAKKSQFKGTVKRAEPYKCDIRLT